jgi:IclR family transcriptional regulator, pca regulon regulatory protein
MRTSVHMLDGPERRNPDYVQSLERGLAVIRAFGAENPELRLSDVARATGLTRAAARRFLLTLVRLGYVRQDGSSFSLRPRVLELGYAYLSALSLPEVAQPHMETLVGEVNESSSVAVLDDLDIVYVARVPTRRIMTITIAVGTRLPAYATSMGRVLLAGLDPEALGERLERIEIERLTATTVPDRKTLRRRIDEVREAGWAAVDQELEQGVRSAAVPIRDASQNVVAALNVSVHATRMTMQALRREVVPKLLRTAEAIEVDLSAQGWDSAVR